MPGRVQFPVFPSDIPTHPLLVIDFQLLRIGDQAEIDRLWHAATTLGFWYINNHGMDDEANAMFDLGRETFALPPDEKLPYRYQQDGSSFGYKAAGSCVVDAKGTTDTTESIDVAQDDVRAYPARVHQAYPAPMRARMHTVVRPFADGSRAINMVVLGILDRKLGLPAGTLAALNTPEDQSGSTIRLIRNPPALSPGAQTFVTAHTDFGSLTILHNRLGGLQVLVPGTDGWQYVKPLEGHAICNIGDTLNIFSGGILRSNLHRVVPPPKEQAQLERWSLVFFTRPNYHVPLCALSDQSTVIADAVRTCPDPSKFSTGVTAGEWLARRIAITRVSNWKDAETWRAGHTGTEDMDGLASPISATSVNCPME